MEAVSSRNSSGSPKRKRSRSAEKSGISNPSNIFYNHDMAIDIPDVHDSYDDVLNSIVRKDMTDSLDLDKNQHD